MNLQKRVGYILSIWGTSEVILQPFLYMWGLNSFNKTIVILLGSIGLILAGMHWTKEGNELER